ncbi:hypothetical protein EJ06DRAFT_224748 [Trichodelitschia bisporula]|uniref:Uncharacterized protein n=1 Tax=Trichodelitschia bisporula TaxID=703511 RepID=A0A6G1HL53_9PEZI|nr:hypothetical protein EJ06DRAFT_224748 [Trichodelitschia bisporula]
MPFIPFSVVDRPTLRVSCGLLDIVWRSCRCSRVGRTSLVLAMNISQTGGEKDDISFEFASTSQPASLTISRLRATSLSHGSTQTNVRILKDSSSLKGHLVSLNQTPTACRHSRPTTHTSQKHADSKSTTIFRKPHNQTHISIPNTPLPNSTEPLAGANCSAPSNPAINRNSI